MADAALHFQQRPTTPTAADRRTLQRRRIIVFATAFFIRAALGTIFWGSIDFINTVGQSFDLVHGRIFSVPYFPLISLYLWLADLLLATSVIPLPLAYKVFTAFYSGLFSVLMFEVVRRHSPQIAFRTALLMACAPVAIINDSFHFQWDTIVLFFLAYSLWLRDTAEESYGVYAWFGVLFALSFLLKPYTLMFAAIFPAPLFIRRVTFSRYIKLHLAAGGAMLVTMGAVFILLQRLGFNVVEIAEGVVKYGNSGITIFGLTFAEPFKHVEFIRSRFWILGVLAVMSLPYHLGWIKSFEFVALGLGLCLAASGLAPQYLIWGIPFLLLSGRYRAAAVYSLIATIFLSLYYAHPLTPFMAHENMITFAPLKVLGWLTPPAAFINPQILPLIHLLGNYAIPATAAITVLAVLGGCIQRFISDNVRNRRLLGRSEPADPTLTPRNRLTALAVFPLILSTFLLAVLNRQEWGASVDRQFGWRDSYLMRLSTADKRFMENITEAGTWLNIVVILIAGGLIWSCYSLFTVARRAQEIPAQSAKTLGSRSNSDELSQSRTAG
jgi:hypothetical protein